MRRRTLTVIVVVALAVIIPLAIVLGPKAVESTDAFKAAEQFARSSPAVIARVGDIQEIAADRSERQSVIFGEGGTAKLMLRVVGNRGTARVRLELTEEKGGWKVSSSDIR